MSQSQLTRFSLLNKNAFYKLSYSLLTRIIPTVRINTKTTEPGQTPSGPSPHGSLGASGVGSGPFAAPEASGAGVPGSLCESETRRHRPVGGGTERRPRPRAERPAPSFPATPAPLIQLNILGPQGLSPTPLCVSKLNNLQQSAHTHESHVICIFEPGRMDPEAASGVWARVGPVQPPSRTLTPGAPRPGGSTEKCAGVQSGRGEERR